MNSFVLNWKSPEKMMMKNKALLMSCKTALQSSVYRPKLTKRTNFMILRLNRKQGKTHLTKILLQACLLTEGIEGSLNQVSTACTTLIQPITKLVKILNFMGSLHAVLSLISVFCIVLKGRAFGSHGLETNPSQVRQAGSHFTDPIKREGRVKKEKRKRNTCCTKFKAFQNPIWLEGRDHTNCASLRSLKTKNAGKT